MKIFLFISELQQTNLFLRQGWNSEGEIFGGRIFIAPENKMPGLGLEMSVQPGVKKKDRDLPDPETPVDV